MSPPIRSVLFVDDEKDILSSLRRLFIDEEWECFFAQNGRDGLDVLNNNRIDLVVSDVRMPIMDGIAFLQEVKRLHPTVVRILLSGYADGRAVTMALTEGCAQQMVSKPWDDKLLSDAIHRAFDLAEKQQQKHRGLQKIINSLSSLPSLPGTYLRVKEMLADRQTHSLNAIAAVIEQDLALPAELIRWANSAAFGQMQQVDTIKRDLAVLGTEIVQGVILSRSAFRFLSAKREAWRGFNRQEFRNHSLGAAIIANRLIKKSFPAEPTLADQAFTAGLLHDIGKLVEESFLPEQFERILDLACSNKTVMSRAELEILGTTHEEIGGHLAQWWNMPSFLVSAIRWHHNPTPHARDSDIIASVHVADMLAHQFAIGSSGNCHPVTVETAALARFDLSDSQMEVLKKEAIEAIR